MAVSKLETQENCRCTFQTERWQPQDTRIVSLSILVSNVIKVIAYVKTMVRLHNGILCSREKEGAYTLCNSMDGTGEHYAKCLRIF